MKKILLATTVLAAAGFTTAANAAEWSTSVNGYWFVGVAVSDAGNQNGLGIMRDGEIHFNSSLKADNGLTFTSRVELEAFTQAGDQIDENWAAVSGSFGTVMIGGNDDAVYNNHVGTIYAPGARIGYFDNFANFTSAAPFNRAGFGLDSLGINYTTPSIAGLQAYGSYHPNFGASDGAADTQNPLFADSNDMFAVGASYNGDFSGVGFGASAGYSDLGGVGDVITLGTYVSASGFKVAATVQQEDPDVGAKSEQYAIGVQYANGPITVGGGYALATNNSGAVIAFGGQEEELVGWVTYALAPGVSSTVGVSYSDSNVAGSTLGGLAYLALSF